MTAIACAVATQLSTRARQAVEHLDGGLPVHAGVGDRLAVRERRAGVEVLASGDQEGLEHDADDGIAAVRDLPRHIVRHNGLAVGVLAAVVVGDVDDHALGQPGGAQLRERVGHGARRRSWARRCLRAG